MNNSKPTQTARILDYMEQFGSITQLEAIRDLGIMRLASRMSELKKQGVPFEKKTETVKNRFGENTYITRYSLKDSAQRRNGVSEK